MGSSFYDEVFQDGLLADIAKLLDFCPEERRLVHGDFGFDNVARDGEAITSVFDWEQSMYGDPLYDVAWLEFWDNNRGYENIFKEHYISQKCLPQNYHERILCYKLLIGLGSMRFYALSDQSEKYEFSKNTVTIIRNIL